ncbi:MAG: methylmalonyl-CoA mutase [Proteobacteria bacterium]|nr:methylmalonyl-CoA mutase [Pseudomonadota bacterium]
MEKSKEQRGLLDEFSKPSYEQWRELVEEQLKGAPFEKKLVGKTADGIPIQPIYLRKDVEKSVGLPTEPGSYPFVRGTRASGHTVKGWEVSQPLDYPLVRQYNEAIRRDTSRGLNRLWIALDRAGKAGLDPDQATPGDVGKSGISVFCLRDLAEALEGIDISALSFQIEAGTASLPFLSLMQAHLESKGIAFGGVTGSLIFDPLGTLAVNGKLERRLDTLYDEMAYLTRWADRQAPRLKILGVDARPYGESGGSAAQELGFAMAVAVEYLREIRKRGLEIDEAGPHFSFTFASGSDFFLEIAKFRAARVLWAQIATALGGNESSQKTTLQVCSSRYNKTVHDPYVNMLRTTTEAFSGVLGGCDAMGVAPFDDVLGLPDEISRRTARNIQIILKEECHGNRVIDPAGGSWFVESLTDELGRKAWSLFQEIEKIGGMTRALEEGFVQKSVAEVDENRRKNLALRKSVAVGTNMYANLEEEPLKNTLPDYDEIKKTRADEVRKLREQRGAGPDTTELEKLSQATDVSADALINAAAAAASKGATLGEITAALDGNGKEETSVSPLSFGRYTEEYEELRKKAAEFKARTGDLPAVFLANMGPLRQHQARADFTTGFLEPGGFSVVSNPGFEGVEEAVQATLASKAPVVVICSTDDTYPDLVPAFTQAVKGEKSDITVVVAGYPKDHLDEFKKIGVDEFIHIRANNLQLLKTFQDKAGVRS